MDTAWMLQNDHTYHTQTHTIYAIVRIINAILAIFYPKAASSRSHELDNALHKWKQ